MDVQYAWDVSTLLELLTYSEYGTVLFGRLFLLVGVSLEPAGGAMDHAADIA